MNASEISGLQWTAGMFLSLGTQIRNGETIKKPSLFKIVLVTFVTAGQISKLPEQSLEC
jgi:hypothetical protein